MKTEDIIVRCIDGIKVDSFAQLYDLGYNVVLPKESSQMRIKALILDPQDYITIFTIHFSLKVAEELAKGTATKMIKCFKSTIRGIWGKHKDTKPALLVASKEPEYKLPKAILSFQVSETEITTLEITNDIGEGELDKLLEAQLNIVKTSYRNNNQINKDKKK